MYQSRACRKIPSLRGLPAGQDYIFVVIEGASELSFGGGGSVGFFSCSLASSIERNRSPTV